MALDDDERKKLEEALRRFREKFPPDEETKEYLRRRALEDVPIDVHLHMLVEGGRVIAQLVFTNKSGYVQYVDPWRSGARGVRTQLFDIYSEGKEVPYIGMYGLKVIPPKPEEYIPLIPGGTYEQKVDITDYYEWLEGEHIYKAQYAQYHDDPYLNFGYLLQSNTATFVYRKPEAAS